jgi:outer membrane protein
VNADELNALSTQAIEQNLAEDDSYWELDVGLAVTYGRHFIQGIDEHEQGDLNASVLLSGGYYYKDFFVEINPLIGRSLTLGYSLQRTQQFVLNVITESLFQGFDQSSQQRGNFLTGINDRKTSLDAGIEAYYSHKYGETRVRMLTDISNTHHGYVIAFDYAYPIFRKRWTFWPSYGISWLSEDTTNYYFGVSATEATPSRPVYQPTSAFTHKFNFYAAYQINAQLSLIFYGDYILFSQNIKQSPLISPNNDSYRIGTGVTWSF